MDEGDKKAWEHGLSQMEMLTDDEKERIALLVCYTAQKVDGRENVSNDEVVGVLKWATGARVTAGLLQNLLDGDVYVRMPSGASQPTFSLSPRGEAAARRLGESMGLPMPEEGDDVHP